MRVEFMLNKLILIFSTAGLLFAGYMSGYKFFFKMCALKETCPVVFGLPACYYGFIMFLGLFLLSVGLVSKKFTKNSALLGLLLVSFLGILFAGNLTLGELPLFFERGFKAYVLGLPTCALGLIFYVLIFSFTLVSKFNKSLVSK